MREGETHTVILSLTPVKKRWRAFELTKGAKRHQDYALRKDRSPRRVVRWFYLL